MGCAPTFVIAIVIPIPIEKNQNRLCNRNRVVNRGYEWTMVEPNFSHFSCAFVQKGDEYEKNRFRVRKLWRDPWPYGNFLSVAFQSFQKMDTESY